MAFSVTGLNNTSVASLWVPPLGSKLPQLSQNVAEGGLGWGGGNVQLRINKNTGGKVLCTAGHVLLPRVNGQLLHPPELPTKIILNGVSGTPIEKLFPDPSRLRLLEVRGFGGQRLDLIRLGAGGDLKAYFNEMVQRQPSQSALITAFKKRGATWEVTTASRPLSYDANRPITPDLAEQADDSRTTARYKITMTALPLQAKDLQQEAKAVGLSLFVETPETWLAIQPIGGDANNPGSNYPGYYLINLGVSGSEAKPSGVDAMDAGNVIAGIDRRNADWTFEAVKKLVNNSRALREALNVAYPGLSHAQIIYRLHQHGLTAVSFITKEVAEVNAAAVDSRSSPVRAQFD